VTGPGVVVDRDLVDTPVPRRSRTRLAMAMVVVLLVVGSSVAVVVLRQGAGRPTQPTAVTRPNPGITAAAVTALLDQRATAIRRHDRGAFVATLDPARPALRRAQLRMFASLARVRFATWSYSAASGAVPTSVQLRYRLAGFDLRPVQRTQYPTFVERGGRAYLSAMSDRPHRQVTDSDLWDFGPVAVVRRASVLVLGARGERSRMKDIAKAMAAAIPRVTAVWGKGWSQRVVVLVPSTQSEMGRIDGDAGDHSDLSQIAAQTSSEISSERGHPSPAGGRVTINPRNWSKLDALGRSVVLTHELTHVATQSATGVQTPRWLEEGFADYVGFQQPGVTVGAAAAELAQEVQAGHPLRALPTDRDFDWSGTHLAAAYEQAWLACRYIAARAGQAGLVRFYRLVGASTQGTAAAVATGLRTVLGLTPAEFTTQWRSYVDRELAG
jgi:hypothetical protein